MSEQHALVERHLRAMLAEGDEAKVPRDILARALLAHVI